MSIAQTMLAEFQPQAALTRKFIERLPQDKLTWQPHPRSFTAGQLAFHLAAVPGGVIRAVQNDTAQAPDFSVPQPTTQAEIIETLDASVTTVKELLPTLDDASMNATWSLLAGDQVLLAIPRYDFLRGIMLNHWYQHRGQFGVYLRLLDIPVPATWGPSADEPPTFMQQN